METLLAVKQRPILFSTPMVQAILEGRKTQTRRVIKNISEEATFFGIEENPELVSIDIEQEEPEIHNGTFALFEENSSKFPYGNIGDILWVRETWNNYNENFYGFPDKEIYLYKANGTDRTCTWKPSIFMPKDACRIFLEIENIKVERLQEISEEDARAEGIEREWDGIATWYKDYLKPNEMIKRYAKESFESLWKFINGKQSWEENQWIWVIEFKKIEKPSN